MKNSILLIIALFVLLSIFRIEIAEAQYIISNSVVANGGIIASNASYFMAGTVGQSLIGVMSNASYVHELGFWVGGGRILGIDTNSETPTALQFYQVYPNPVSNELIIRFSLPGPEHVVIRLHDLAGKVVATIVDVELEPGEYAYGLSTNDLANSFYYLRLTTTERTMNQAIQLIR